LTFGGRGLIRGLAFGGRGLIRGLDFGGVGLIRGLTFGGRSLIRGDYCSDIYFLLLKKGVRTNTCFLLYYSRTLIYRT
jgi:hypothetical protein